MSDDRLRALVDSVHLADIRITSIEGTVNLRQGVNPARADDAPAPVEFGIAVAVADGTEGLLTSLSGTQNRQATPSTPEVRMSVEVAAFYELTGWNDEDLDEELLGGFIHRVAMYQMLPFLREAFFDLATRLRVPAPVLPLMPQDLGPGELIQN